MSASDSSEIRPWVSPDGHALAGVIPPMVTPLLDRGVLDVAGTDRQVARLLRAGVHGIFLAGTTGEGPNLATDLKEELVTRVAAQVRGRVPLIAGLSSAVIGESQRFAAHCAAHGVTAMAVSPPSYFRLNQAELLAWFRELAVALPLPILIYHIPSMTGTQITAATMRELISLPSVVGVKDSSGQMVYHHELLQLAAAHQDLSVFMGPEEILPESVMAGGHGCIPAGANVDPALFVAFYGAARSGDRRRIEALRAQVYVLRRIYGLQASSLGLVHGVKTALRELGVCGDAMSVPTVDFDAAALETVHAVLSALSLSDALPALPIDSPGILAV